MSEKEKKILKRLCDTVPQLNQENQKYILGLAEGMAILGEAQVNQPVQEYAQV